jgi:post-segregation antitoxin (ccd killing protein)
MEKELRVYGVDVSKVYEGLMLESIIQNKLTQEQWQEEAEAQGNVWSISGFTEAFNSGSITYDTLIKFY